MDKEKVQKAEEFAKKHLNTVKRFAGDSEFDHVCRVASVLIETGVNDTNTLVAAYLHSVLTTSPNLELEISTEFGNEVLSLIQLNKKLSATSVDKVSPKELNEAYIMQTYMSLASDVRVLAIRLADKLDSLNTAFALQKDQRFRLANKTLYLYAPLAEMLRIGRLYSRLQNAAFRILDPGEYNKISRYLSEREDEMNALLDDFHKFMGDLLVENNIVHTITSRLKHPYSIYKKSKYTKTKVLNDIKDIAGIRIITDTVENCYVIENIIFGLFSHYPSLRDDYIATPRASGYKSLHNIIKLNDTINVEVQIRTKEMHEYNEFGPASHVLYKIGDKGAKSLSVGLFKSYIRDNPNLFKEINYWESLRNNNNGITNVAFDKNVYVFTPKGDIIELPKDSCVIDFAYALHTTIGDRCVGALVNKRYVGVDYKVQTGDYIEVKTASKFSVNTSWLRIAKTARAREHIRKLMRKEK